MTVIIAKNTVFMVNCISGMTLFPGVLAPCGKKTQFFYGQNCIKQKFQES